MILFDYECEKCLKDIELCVSYEEKDEQKCTECGIIMRRCVTSKPEKAFTPHYSVSLGANLESREHRNNIINDIRERSVECKPRHKRQKRVFI